MTGKKKSRSRRPNRGSGRQTARQEVALIVGGETEPGEGIPHTVLESLKPYDEGMVKQILEESEYVPSQESEESSPPPDIAKGKAILVEGTFRCPFHKDNNPIELTDLIFCFECGEYWKKSADHKPVGSSFLGKLKAITGL